jgi:hypothetical protein
MPRIKTSSGRFRRQWTRWFGRPHELTTAERFRHIPLVEQLEGLFMPNLLFLPGIVLADAGIPASADGPAVAYAPDNDAPGPDQAADTTSASDVSPDLDPTPTTPAADTPQPDTPPATPPRPDDANLQNPVANPLQDPFASSDWSGDERSSGTFAPSSAGGSASGSAAALTGSTADFAVAASFPNSVGTAPARPAAPALSEESLTALASTPLSLGSAAPASTAPATASAAPALPAAAPAGTVSNPTAPAQPATTATRAASADAAAVFGQLPLAFEPNQGQFAAGTTYQTYTSNFTVDLNATSATFGMASAQGTAATVSMNLVGGNAAAAPVAGVRLPGTVNYLLGQDQSNWIRDVPLYSQVAFQNVYPGIDLVYHGGSQQQQLEYDFVIAPGADPSAIRLAFAGASTPTLDSAGNLLLAAGPGNLVQQAPVAYQPAADGSRVAVNGSFALLGNGQVGFQVGAHDPTRPLVIDPIYSTFLGSPVDHQVNHVAVDSAGNAYVVGTRTVPPDPSYFQVNAMDAFAAKLDPNGNLVYMTYVGGTQFWPGYYPPLEGGGDEAGNGIAVDQYGQAYITGWTSSTNFPVAAPPGVTPYQNQLQFNPVTNPRGAMVNAFLSKLDAAGDALLYSTYVGRTHYGDGTGFSYRNLSWPADNYTFNEWEQYGQAVAVDAAGNAYFVGSTSGLQAIAHPICCEPPLIANPFHNVDAWMHRINTVDGSATIRWQLFVDHDPGAWGNDYEATGATVATGVALEKDADDPVANLPPVTPDHVFVTGYTSATDIVVTPNAFQPQNNNQQGGGGGGGGGAGLGGGAGGNDNAFVSKIDLPDPDNDDTELPSDPDSVNQAWDFDYSTYLGGQGDDKAYDIAVDANGLAFVTGHTPDDSSFPTTPNAYQTLGTTGLLAPGAAFVTELNYLGTAEVYSTLLGGLSTIGYGIALDDNDLIYVTGETFNGANPPQYASAMPPPEPDGETEWGGDPPGYFPITANNTDPYSREAMRAFLTTLTNDGSPPAFSTFHGGDCSGRSVAVYLQKDALGNIIDRQPVVGGLTGDDLPLVNAEQPVFGDGSVEDDPPDHHYVDGFVAKWSKNMDMGG